ncbi:SPFH domain / Band 7 family protein [Orientia tsutsugamushi str. UT76]|nr:SPFH domain / Band 7 family protein [Orientia tsutsugamushi str. UT76]
MILSINIINIFVLVALGIILFNVFKIVPQQQAWIIERLGKLHKVLPAGLNFINPNGR